jgi:hypothetical protein
MNIFLKYKNITDVDIEEFFNDYTDFLNSDYQSVVLYFAEGGDLPGSVVIKLDRLLGDCRKILNTFRIYRNSLSENFEFWELLEQLENINISLNTIQKSSKWYRSNKSIYNDNKVEVDYILKQNQTLERLASDVGYEDPNNDWVAIAMRNQLQEEDYSVEGGNLLKITFENNFSFKILSVIDSISGEKVYGIDFDKEITFSDLDIDGYYDLTTLSYRKTVEQSYSILLKTVKGSVPEFPEDGVNKEILGGNINSIQFPILFRQLGNLFVKDDSFKDFKVVDVVREEDRQYITVQVKTRLDEILDQQLTIL